MDKIRVLIIDEQESFRESMRQKLSQQPDFYLLDYDPSKDLMATVDENYPDAVLLGSNMVAVDSATLSREIVRRYPNVRVIVMSPRPNDDELFEFIKTAAVAYLDKRTSAEELYSTIRRSYHGEYPINESIVTRPAVAQYLLTLFGEIASMGDGMASIAAPLTHIEKLILTCVTNYSYKKQIARTLRVNERTVENHVSAILRKLITYERAHAVARSMQDDLISADR